VYVLYILFLAKKYISHEKSNNNNIAISSHFRSAIVVRFYAVSSRAFSATTAAAVTTRRSDMATWGVTASQQPAAWLVVCSSIGVPWAWSPAAIWRKYVVCIHAPSGRLTRRELADVAGERASVISTARLIGCDVDSKTRCWMPVAAPYVAYAPIDNDKLSGSSRRRPGSVLICWPEVQHRKIPDSKKNVQIIHRQAT